MTEVISKTKNIIFFILNIVISVITVGLVFSLVGKASEKDTYYVAFFQGLALASLVLYHIFLFIKYANAKDRIRITIVALIYAGASVLAFIGEKDTLFLSLSSFTFIIGLALSQILRIFIHNKEKTKLGIVTNALIGITLLVFSVAIIITMKKTDPITISVVCAVIILAISLKNILIPSLKFAKVKVFLEVLIKTHTIDVVVCLLAIIVVFSFLFPMFEEAIKDYWDGMWYCFAIITTIGFGDYVAVTPVGRVLTVLLGIYGIVVIAILTSAIVNYYGEVTKKEKKDDKYIE